MLVALAQTWFPGYGLQSSSEKDLIRNAFVYNRIANAIVVQVRHKVIVSITKLFRFGGLIGFGTTPAGGAPAGPFKSF